MQEFGAGRTAQYHYLNRESARNMKYFALAVAGLIVCLLFAFAEGAAGGWPWLLGGLVFVFLGIWALVEARYYDLRMALHSLPEDLRKRS